MIINILKQLSREKKLSVLNGIASGKIKREDLNDSIVMEILSSPKPLIFCINDYSTPFVKYSVNSTEITEEEYERLSDICTIFLKSYQCYTIVKGSNTPPLANTESQIVID